MPSSADVVVPQVEGRAVVQSSAAADGDQICLVEDDRQCVTGSQAQLTHACDVPTGRGRLAARSAAAQ